METMTYKFSVVCGGSGEYLLGQRRTLGLHGELQIDVKGELEKTRARLGRLDDYYYPVRADSKANVKAVFEAIPAIAADRHWGESILKHANFVADNWIHVTALVDGLAQAPAIGGLAILIEEAQEQLRGGISSLLKTYPAGSDLEFWIVSSTAGGTGEGTHRAVAEKIIEVVKSKDYKSLKIKFIRIGRATYKTITEDRSAISTFCGLAADAMFENEMGEKYGGNAATINWFYVDIPDYGAGDDAKQIRGPVIELVAKALMLDELAPDLDKLGINANTIIFRVGFWGKEYEDKDLYYATLEGLIRKLDQFITPSEEELTPIGTRPRFESNGLVSLLPKFQDSEYLINAIDEEGWSISSFAKPGEFEGLKLYIEDAERSISKLVKGDFYYKYLTPSPEFKVATQREAGKIEDVKFETKVSAAEIGSRLWFDDVHRAQVVKTWSKKLLGLRRAAKQADSAKRSKLEWYTTDGLLAQLFETHAKCKKILRGGVFRNTQVIANELTKVLENYTTLLVQVRILFDEFIKADGLLTTNLQEAGRVREFAKARLTSLSVSLSSEVAPIVPAELYDVLDRLNNCTWFKLVYDEVIATRIDAFREEVMRGAVGLTANGLKEVLGLKPTDGIDAIKRELRENMGRMYDRGGNPVLALWFSGQDPAQRKKNSYSYRLLPKLEEGFDLGISKDGDISYKYPALGILGLKVLALEGVTIANANDEVTTHTFLASPFVKTVREVLANKSWFGHIRGQDSSCLTVTTSAVVGDPLSYEILERAGLTKTEIDKLDEYLYIKSFAKNKERETPKSKGKTRLKAQGEVAKK